jgi:hypothetical protein
MIVGGAGGEKVGNSHPVVKGCALPLHDSLQRQHAALCQSRFPVVREQLVYVSNTQASASTCAFSSRLPPFLLAVV